MTLKFASIALLGLFSLTACTSQPTKTAATPAAPATAPAQPALNDEAKTALAQAEADIKKAKKAQALWTSADKAMKDAKKAAEAGDSAGVLKNAKVVAEQVALGIGQKAYPLTELP